MRLGLFFLLALRNLLKHPRKTVLLGALIAIGSAMLLVGTAIFDDTTQGLERSFRSGLTGDFALESKADIAYGLFGSEMPIVSEYESIPAITGYKAIAEKLGSIDSIELWSPLVSAAAQVDIGGWKVGVPVLGVESSSYFKLCSSIDIGASEVAALEGGGVLVNSALAAQAEAALGRKLVVGEPVTFSVYQNGSFRIRQGNFAGVYRYAGSTEVMDRIVLADPSIVRALVGYTLGVSAAEAKAGAAVTATAAQAATAAPSLDELFSSAGDTTTSGAPGLRLSSVEAQLADTKGRDFLATPDSAAWSFVLFRAKAGQVDRAARELASLARGAGWDTRQIGWREEAGSSATAIFALQGFFYLGMGILALGAILVITNALVISVLERSGEIGSMRALGASRGFVSGLFMAESLLLTMISAAIGIGIGGGIAALLARKGIPLANPILQALFGGPIVRPVVSLSSVLLHFAGAMLVGSLAWIYPVAVAVRIEPATAMGKAQA